MVGRDHGIELAAHRTHEHRVGRKRSRDCRRARRRREQSIVFIAEPAAVARVRVQRTESESRIVDGEPFLEATARHVGRIDNRFEGESLANIAQRDVGRRQHDPQLVRRQHHRHPRSSELGEHLCMAGVVVAAREQRRLVDRRGDDAIDVSVHRQLHRPLDGEAAQLSRGRHAHLCPPVANRFLDFDSCASSANDYDVKAPGDPGVGERFHYYLRANSAGIADGHGEASLHALHPDRHVGLLAQIVEQLSN